MAPSCKEVTNLIVSIITCCFIVKIYSATIEWE